MIASIIAIAYILSNDGPDDQPIENRSSDSRSNIRPKQFIVLNETEIFNVLLLADWPMKGLNIVESDSRED